MRPAGSWGLVSPNGIAPNKGSMQLHINEPAGCSAVVGVSASENPSEGPRDFATDERLPLAGELVRQHQARQRIDDSERGTSVPVAKAKGPTAVPPHVPFLESVLVHHSPVQLQSCSLHYLQALSRDEHGRVSGSAIQEHRSAMQDTGQAPST